MSNSINNKKNNKHGFSLVEILAVIVIISVVAFIGITAYFKIINNSKLESLKISSNNIIEAAILYAKENNNSITWGKTFENENKVKYEFSCITINELINAGYYNDKSFKKYLYLNSKISKNNYILIRRDYNNKANYSANILENINDEQRCYNKANTNDNTDNNTNDNTDNNTNDNTDNNTNDNTDNNTDDNTDNNTDDNTNNVTEHTVNIQYNANGGEVKSQTEDNNNKYSWNTDNSGLISRTTNGNNSTTNITVVEADKEVQFAKYNDPNYLTISKIGYTVVKNYEWCTNSDGTGKCYNQDSQYNASELCDATDSDCTVTLYVNWKPKPKVNIRYNTSGGSMASKHGTGYSIDKSGNVNHNNSILTQIIYYNEKIGENGLYNYNSTSAINLVKKGYIAESGKEWCTGKNGSGTCYSQSSEDYKASNFCKESTKDCTVTLYVNWQPKPKKVTIIKKTYTYCPDNQNKPTREKCLNNSYNKVIIKNVTVNGTKVTFDWVLHMNEYSVSWEGNKERALCVVKEGESKCYKKIKSWTMSSNWICKDCDKKGTTTINIDNKWENGKYKITVVGEGKAFVFTNNYQKNIFEVSN